MSMFVVIWYFLLYVTSEHAIWKCILNIDEALMNYPHLKVQFPLSERCFCGKILQKGWETCAGGSGGKWQKHQKNFHCSHLLKVSLLGANICRFFFGGVPPSWIVSVLGEVKILLRGKNLLFMRFFSDPTWSNCCWWVTFWKLVEMTHFDKCYLNIWDIPERLFDAWRVEDSKQIEF